MEPVFLLWNLKESENARCEKGKVNCVCRCMCWEKRMGDEEVDEDKNGREEKGRELVLGLVEVGRELEKEWWRREKPRVGCGSVGCATYPMKTLTGLVPLGGGTGVGIEDHRGRTMPQTGSTGFGPVSLNRQ
jgi:hypothetical protein